LELDLASEENLREQAKAQLQEMIRKLCCCLGMDVCEPAHLTPECIITKTNDVVNELQRLRSKLASTCENLTSCESELHGLRNASATERSHLNAQIESLKTITTGLEARCKSTERDLQLTRDRLTETDMGADKLRGAKGFAKLCTNQWIGSITFILFLSPPHQTEELRGFESRCCRLQSSLDRVQNDRLVFLKNIGSIINVPEPCESLIKDKVREIMNENQTMHNVSSGETFRKLLFMPTW